MLIQDEMVGWHHRLNGHEFKQALRDGENSVRLYYSSYVNETYLGTNLIKHARPGQDL